MSDVESPLNVVDFTTPKDFTRSKPTRKRKRVGNRIPVGEKVSKSSASHRAPTFSTHSYPSESDLEESYEHEEVDTIHDGSESASEEDQNQPATFSGALSSLLDRASQSRHDPSKAAPILKDAPKKTEDEDSEARRIAKEKREQSKLAILQRKLFQNKDHRVPDFSGADLEAKLRKVATRGVVKLFNAIKQHQKTAAMEAKPEIRTVTDAKTKKRFMETLKRKDTQNGTHSAESDSDEEQALAMESKTKELKRSLSTKTSTGSTPSWEVLRDDYLLGAKMKDWNKESDEE